jgi:putative SbcD/Mre11-related phosphoesterase
MQLVPGILADQTAVFIQASKTLVLSDLHLGYEEELRRKGIFIPTGEFARIEKLLEHLINTHKPKTIVLNGDTKHGFGTINSSEWRHTRKILEVLQRKARVIVVEGNHDPKLAPVARAAGITIEPYHAENGVLCLHGDLVPEPALLKDVHTLIMGHEHPAVALSNGIRSETYKCFLVLEYKKRTLVVLPSTFGLTHGFDVLASKTTNPLLKELGSAAVYAVEEQTIVPCGTVNKLREALPKTERSQYSR